MLSQFLEACAALTAGIRTVPTELVMAEGKRIQGRAMPVSTPYMLSASLVLMPESLRQAGIEAASTLCSRVTAVRLAVRGMERESSSRRFFVSEDRTGR